MSRFVLAVGLLMMQGNAHALTVLNTSVADATANHDVETTNVAAANPQAAQIAAAVQHPPAAKGRGSQVPDVVTWGLMIAGFGYIGLAASRRRPEVTS